MAIYEGARPRSGFLNLPIPASQAPSLPRRKTRSPIRARRRASRVGLVLGGIVLTFLLAFFSLAQSVRVSATGYDLERLSAEHDRLEGQRQQLISDLNRLGREPAIRKQAIDAGLAPLPAPLVVPAR
jgi:hypothetical protein